MNEIRLFERSFLMATIELAQPFSFCIGELATFGWSQQNWCTQNLGVGRIFVWIICWRVKLKKKEFPFWKLSKKRENVAMNIHDPNLLLHHRILVAVVVVWVRVQLVPWRSFEQSTSTDRNFHEMDIHRYVAKDNSKEFYIKTISIHRIQNVHKKILTALSSARNRWVASNGQVSSLIWLLLRSHFTKCVWRRCFKITWHLLYGQMTVSS